MRDVEHAADHDERRLAPRVGDDRCVVVAEDAARTARGSRRRSSCVHRSTRRWRRSPSRARPRRRASARRTSRCRRSRRPARSRGRPAAVPGTLRLENWPGREGGIALARRIRVRVREQRARVERVRDRDGLAGAGETGARDPVGAAELRRDVPTRRHTAASARGTSAASSPSAGRSTSSTACAFTKPAVRRGPPFFTTWPTGVRPLTASTLAPTRRRHRDVARRRLHLLAVHA